MQGKIYPKTNISKAYYKHLVNQIEHDPLVKHTTMTVACMIAAVCILLGALVWFARSNPGNLIQVPATVTHISSGRTDAIGTITTFITFDFVTKEGEQKSVRQAASEGIKYSVGSTIKAGYHPKNPNFARNLSDNRPPFASIALWCIPFLIMIWFIFVALFRYNKRQHLIWAAAEAADSDD